MVRPRVREGQTAQILWITTRMRARCSFQAGLIGGTGEENTGEQGCLTEAGAPHLAARKASLASRVSGASAPRVRAFASYARVKSDRASARSPSCNATSPRLWADAAVAGW